MNRTNITAALIIVSALYIGFIVAKYDETQADIRPEVSYYEVISIPIITAEPKPEVTYLPELTAANETPNGWTLNTATETPEPTPYPVPPEEIRALAQMLTWEVVADRTNEAVACAWVVLNRVGDTRFPDTLIEVLAAPNQFSGYTYGKDKEPTDFALDVANGVLAAYYGNEGYNRNIEPDICFFSGDGSRNYFGSYYPVLNGFTVD
jgi:hypothetical protein